MLLLLCLGLEFQQGLGLMVSGWVCLSSFWFGCQVGVLVSRRVWAWMWFESEGLGEGLGNIVPGF